MHETVKKQILEEIKTHATVILSRHQRPDGDAVGATLGLAAILRASYPEKRVFLDSEDYSDHVAFLGDEGPRPTDEDYRGALVIVLDAGTRARISNTRIDRGDLLIKIDHHVEEQAFGDISWVEPNRPAVCEMIVDFFSTFRDELKMTPAAATALYAGIVTDTGRFRYRGTSGETLRAAALLLEYGVDTEWVYTHLYLKDIAVLRCHAALTGKIQTTEHGVAWLYISRAMRRRRGLSMEEAGNVTELMEVIKGSLVWIAFIETDDGAVRVRLRSRFAEIRQLAARYHGGGHACASGATVYSREERDALLAEADALLADYKRFHPDLF